MKKNYIITGAMEVETNRDYQKGTTSFYAQGDEYMQVSDGYHTMDELYEHRIALFIALCNHKHELLALEDPGKHQVWRSKTHSDGSKFEGWFVLGIGLTRGNQITYHLPLSRWDDCNFAETGEFAPEFDGHSSKDVLERLAKL